MSALSFQGTDPLVGDHSSQPFSPTEKASSDLASGLRYIRSSNVIYLSGPKKDSVGSNKSFSEDFRDELFEFDQFLISQTS